MNEVRAAQPMGADVVTLTALQAKSDQLSAAVVDVHDAWMSLVHGVQAPMDIARPGKTDDRIGDVFRELDSNVDFLQTMARWIRERA